MTHVRFWLILSLVFAARSASAQDLSPERPKLYAGPPLTEAQKDQRSSLYRYAYGLLCEKEDRMIEALTAFEEAAELDPNAPGVYKAQVPLLLMMDRPRDALGALKRVLQLDPTDHDSWFLAARLHKGLGEMKQYRKALDKGLATPGLVEDRPQLAQQFYYDLGQYLETAAEIPEAIAAYTASAKILDHPEAILDHGPFLRESIVAKSAETYEKIGDLHRKLKNFDSAIAAYRTAQQRQPDAAGRINLNLAKLYQDKGALAEALTAVDGYLRLLPQGTDAYQMKIDLLTKLTRTNEILPWLERASTVDSLNVNLKLLLGQQYAVFNRMNQAEDLFLAMADESPSEDVYRGLFRLPRADSGRFILTQFDKAVRTASKKPPEAGSLRAADQARAMLAVLKEDAQVSKKMLDAAYRPDQAERELNYETRFFLAALADKYGKLGQAEQFYRRALEAPGQINEAPLYGGLLRILWKGHKYEEVVRVCEAGIKNSQFTNHVLFYHELARAYARLSDFRKAEAAAQKAIDIAADRDRLSAYEMQVSVLIQAEKFAQAEAVCKKLLEESAGSAPGDINEVRYRLSNVYSAWKKIDLAAAQLQEILKADPSNATVHNDLGYIWADHNRNLKESEELIRRAIDLDRRQRKAGANEDKDNANYVDSLGWVLFRRGDFDAARRELERAVSLPDGDEPALWDHLGDVYARMGRYVQAQSAYQRAVQLYEEERVRALDERYREVRRKLDQVKTQVRSK